MRRIFLFGSFLCILLIAVVSLFLPLLLWLYALVIPLVALGIYDILQKKHSILRNFPLLGHFRYLFEMIRPEINQYFIESNTDGRPFNREQRSLVYQRAKSELQTLPFGTQHEVYDEGYEWIVHSLAPSHVEPEELSVTIGDGQCAQPYQASIFNISAMSFGSLGSTAIRALNRGAKLGSFAHNTGEGGVSPHHLEEGGDLIWQLGTGYFGCRDKEGHFAPEPFQDMASRPEVKMIEVKLSQGAKPSHGGILPAAKVTSEIAGIRLVSLGQDVISPPTHSAFTSPIEMMEFLQYLRELSGGKPVGIKLCVGRRHELFALCKAMLATELRPDFIAVDGAEGGTGAAPLEFSNYLGSPLTEGLFQVHNTLTGFELRDKVRVMASGRISSGFDVVHKLGIGADLCYSARAMMFALGCIQALRCNANNCPTGVATQDPELTAGLDITDKGVRVANFHRETVKSVAEFIGAMGLPSSAAVKPWHILRRTNPFEVKNLYELFDYVEPGAFLGETKPERYRDVLYAARADTFNYQRP